MGHGIYRHEFGRVSGGVGEDEEIYRQGCQTVRVGLPDLAVKSSTLVVGI